MRIGQGLDVHAFSSDSSRELWLGLIRVEGQGLSGHSDADVVTHALCDALLGAAGLGDIGEHFPDSDEQWRGAASKDLLQHVCQLLRGEGFRVVNADLTVICETPRLGDAKAAMSAALSECVGAPVSVKATTTEHLGFIGRGEGIAALAVALVENI